jgi:hypothetical protein
MKIGLSYSRCVRDIVDGVVDINDVLIVIARTDFDPNDDKQWDGIWASYRIGFMSHPEWADYPDEDEDRFRSISIQLWSDGKFHQPRKFGAHQPRRREVWLEAVLPSIELEKNVAAKDAWERFQVVAQLAGASLKDGEFD